MKRAKVYKEYFADATFMSRHLLDGGPDPEHEQYKIMILSHSLEKGLSYRNARVFGRSKAEDLMARLEKSSPETRTSSAFSIGVEVLRSWTDFIKSRENDVQAASIRGRLDALIEVATPSDRGFRGGVATATQLDSSSWKELPFEDFVRGRHSTRRFTDLPVSDDDLQLCIELAMRSPSACNRQMVGLRVFDDPKSKELLYRTLHGTGGVDFDTCRLAVVTFDTRSLDFYGERNQGYLNAGLFAMTLVYALQWKGIGSCLLQFGNTFAEERALAEGLSLQPGERIAVGIAFGVPEPDGVVPASIRRDISEVFSVR
ncbi:nitroreductase family protein [Gordonia jinghuaiqii]|uniref:Nitroreductase family protein n=1 Tax=Gordonia jinghuaiqii TaxID=2758710 RepID=A0A7D7LSX2_9ACTN|nr:nitroreductase family protein [Gordonia jinghuaiqii]QMT02583.1 nitroreductase family protein [Gordonia jinghuaiqii]